MPDDSPRGHDLPGTAPEPSADIADPAAVLKLKSAAGNLPRISLTTQAPRSCALIVQNVHLRLLRRFGRNKPNGRDACVPARREAPMVHGRTTSATLQLASVLDMRSRRIVGFALGERYDAELACDALTMAVAVRGGGLGHRLAGRLATAPSIATRAACSQVASRSHGRPRSATGTRERTGGSELGGQVLEMDSPPSANGIDV
jgi:transposase InsO family protein